VSSRRAQFLLYRDRALDGVNGTLAKLPKDTVYAVFEMPVGDRQGIHQERTFYSAEVSHQGLKKAKFGAHGDVIQQTDGHTSRPSSRGRELGPIRIGVSL